MQFIDPSGRRGFISHVLDLNSPYGRFILRNISIAVFSLIFIILMVLLVSNLVICLQRKSGLIQKNNIFLHFVVCMGFFLFELIGFLLVMRFFWEDTWERIQNVNHHHLTAQEKEEEKEVEHSLRSYLLVNTASLISFVCYLVFIYAESYQQAYWSIFASSIFYIYSHCLIVAKIQEYSLYIEKYQSFPNEFIYVAVVSFLGVVCLIINTLILADQS
jgi:hypothetical protein